MTPPPAATPPLRILHLSPAPIYDVEDGKGMPSIFLGLKGAVDRGHQVVFAVAGRVNRDYDYHGIRIHEWRIPVPVARIEHRWRHRLTQKLWGAAYYLIATIKGLRLAATFRPHVVYGQFLYAAPVAWLIGRVRGIPNITRMYGTFLFPYVGSWWGRLWKAEEVLAFVTPCTYLICTNDGTRGRDVARALGVPAERLRFWRNGVNMAMYDPHVDRDRIKDALRIPRQHRLIVAISRLADWKRVDRLIAAMPEVIRGYPDVTAVIVGDGPERGRLEAMAQQLGVLSHVRFAGSVPHTDVPLYLNAADIFTSLYDLSNVGNPILEALVCGKCVVSINNGGTAELNEHGEAALLLEPDQLDTLASTYLRLLRDDALRQRYERAARSYAEQHLKTWPERVRLETDLIEQLAAAWPYRPNGSAATKSSPPQGADLA